MCLHLVADGGMTSTKHLQLVQNAAARLLPGARKREHVSQLLASLHCFPGTFSSSFEDTPSSFSHLEMSSPQLTSLSLPHPAAPAQCLGSADMKTRPDNDRKVLPKTKLGFVVYKNRIRCIHLCLKTKLSVMFRGL